MSAEELCCRGLLPADLCGPLYVRTNEVNSCDAYLYDYCKRDEGRYDVLCSCINSEIPFPDCFDNTCRGSGAFLPKNMIKQPCPTVLNCTQVVNIGENAKNNLVNVAQYQTCIADSGGGAKTAGAEPTVAITNENVVAPPPKPAETSAPKTLATSPAITAPTNTEPAPSQVSKATPPPSSKEPTAPTNNKDTLYIGIGVVVVLAVSAGIAAVVKKKKKVQSAGYARYMP
jgi:hypothetical protein